MLVVKRLNLKELKLLCENNKYISYKLEESYLNYRQEYLKSKFENHSYYIEDENKNLDHPEISPRLGLNYRISPSNTIRYAVAKAIRTPDVLEMDREWNYFIHNLSVPVNGETNLPLFHTATANGDLN